MQAKLAEEKAALEAAFEACLAKRDASGACQCGPECAMAKMVRCSVCHEIKKGRCRVATCAQPRLLLTDKSSGPLLLTHNGD